MLRRTLISLALAAIPFGFASAAPITMQFTASGFDSNSGSSGIPTDPVNGTIKWKAASFNAPVDEFTSIDLTIGGYKYLLSDLGFFIPNSSKPKEFVIGGKLLDDGLKTEANDFLITWFADTPNAELFQYTVSGVNDVFFARSIDSFSVTADATNGTEVPEPATGALLGLVLGGLALVRRRSAS